MHWLDGISLDDNLISGRASGSNGDNSDGNQRKSTQSSSSPTKASRLHLCTIFRPQCHTPPVATHHHSMYTPRPTSFNLLPWATRACLFGLEREAIANYPCNPHPQGVPVANWLPRSFRLPVGRESPNQNILECTMRNIRNVLLVELIKNQNNHYLIYMSV